jgi:ribose 5-phosphate isomerase
VEASQAPEAAASQATEDEILLGLSTDGFTPAEVTHPAGAFAISVDNQDVAGEYVLQLKGEGGALLNEVRVQKGSAGWTVDLAAGTYTLMVANHPAWVCQITVQ